MSDDLARLRQLEAELPALRQSHAAELELRDRLLSEALGQQTATAEIPRVIASVPSDLQPLLDAVGESAGRLSRSTTVVLGIRDGGLLRAVATFGTKSAV